MKYVILRNYKCKHWITYYLKATQSYIYKQTWPFDRKNYIVYCLIIMIIMSTTLTTMRVVLIIFFVQKIVIFPGAYKRTCVCSFLKGLLSLISGQRSTLKLNVRICIKFPSYTWPVLRKWEAALCLLDIVRSGRQVKLKLLGIFWQIMTLGDSSVKIRSYFPIYPPYPLSLFS